MIIEQMETEADWDAHVAGFVTSCAPEGKLEEELVKRLAFIFWRMHRLQDYETAQVNYQVHTTERDLASSEAWNEAMAEAYATGIPQTAKERKIDPRKVAAYQHLHTVPAGSALDKVIRYEAHLHRLWIQTHHELEALQARRRGERTPLARFDFSAPPQG